MVAAAAVAAPDGLATTFFRGRPGLFRGVADVAAAVAAPDRPATAFLRGRPGLFRGVADVAAAVATAAEGAPDGLETAFLRGRPDLFRGVAAVAAAVSAAAALTLAFLRGRPGLWGVSAAVASAVAARGAVLRGRRPEVLRAVDVRLLAARGRDGVRVTMAYLQERPESTGCVRLHVRCAGRVESIVGNRRSLTGKSGLGKRPDPHGLPAQGSSGMARHFCHQAGMFG